MLGATGACSNSVEPGSSFGSGVCFGFCGSYGPYPAYRIFGLSPDSGRILRGDTTSFHTWSCMSDSASCDRTPNEWSRWTIDGDAAAAVVADGAPANGIESNRIHVRGVAVGESRITAVMTSDTTQTRTVRIFIADSSAITTIDMSDRVRQPDTLRVGLVRLVDARLLDAQGAQYSGRPTAWSVSDTSVLELGPTSFVYGRTEERWVTAKKPGTSEVRATFLGVSAAIRVTVVP